VRTRSYAVFGALAVFLGAAVYGGAQVPAAAAPAGGRRGAAAAAGGEAQAPRRPNFPQQTRALASPEVIARGKAVFGVNCVACHGSDLRGGDMGGPNLLRSTVTLNDQHGELIEPIVHGARQDKGMPAFQLTNEDITAIAEYIHSVLSLVGSQGRPPGAEKIPEMKVIVGDPTAGKAYFDKTCAGCHTVTGDLAGFATKFPEPRTLQNTWVSGSATAGRPARGSADGSTVTVTLPGGQKLEGPMIEGNEFIVTLMTPDGRRSFERVNGVPKIEIHEKNEAHKKMVLSLNNKDMHDVTAYLATIK
jgi:cytochrome c oxidase cbb3-type subunit 3